MATDSAAAYGQIRYAAASGSMMQNQAKPRWLVVLAASCFACSEGERTEVPVHEGWAKTRIDSLESVLPQLLADYRVPGVSIVLTQGEEVHWAAGFGITGQDDSPVTPRTVFQVASLGKPVFAHLVNRMEETAEWSLNAPIGTWGSNNSFSPDQAALSAEALLGHTSGMYYDDAMDRVLIDAEKQGHWKYSGAGYVLLQRALEGVSQASLEELSKSFLFEPWELGSMAYARPTDVPVAMGHDRSGNVISDLDWAEANAASSLYSNALDYGRFLILASAIGESNSRSWARLTQPRSTVREDLGLYWGLGWALEREGTGNVAAFHWGSNPGFKSFAFLDRDRQMGVVVLTNSDNGLELAERIIGILDRKRHPLFEFYMLHPDD